MAFTRNVENGMLVVENFVAEGIVCVFIAAADVSEQNVMWVISSAK